MTIMDYSSLCNICLRSLNFEIVDNTSWTQTFKFVITALFENLNIVHPNKANISSFFWSSDLRE